MFAKTSDCLRSFGHTDFDSARLDESAPLKCPVRGCAATPLNIPFGKRQDSAGKSIERTLPWCPEHGIKLHSGTFVYWNGQGLEDEARLRNFVVKRDLAPVIALRQGMKAESHRLGYEMSEDALSWNVFVSLAEAGRLRQTAELLTGRRFRSEPDLYLWGRRIDLVRGDYELYPPLLEVRNRLEPDIRTFVTEPDIMLVAPNEMIVCIEAKFGSPNRLAHDVPTVAGAKPTAKDGLLARYLAPSHYARQSIRSDRIGKRFHSQLFRNVVFACEMAGELPWHVVNLVSSTQRGTTETDRDSFSDPSPAVREYLHPDRQHCFTYGTWEDLHTKLIKDDPSLRELEFYLRGKSAHYLPAFKLSRADLRGEALSMTPTT